MERSLRRTGLAVAAALLAGCQSAGRTDMAVIEGTVHVPNAARAGAPGATTFLEIAAVDPTGRTVDLASAVTDEFRLSVPTGHDYVLVVADVTGVIGGLRYGPAGVERAAFSVPNGLGVIDMGRLSVDPRGRTVRAQWGEKLVAPERGPEEDTDQDGVPDAVDADDDNDGREDTRDISGSLRDRSRDHDNDGITDDRDEDDDNDSIADALDQRPRDFDNDGEDDDRDLDDDETFPDHPRHAGLLGDPAFGRAVYEASGCGTCHGELGTGGSAAPESIRGESAREIASALRHGETNAKAIMPACPGLVDAAPDLAAFLSGMQSGEPRHSPAGVAIRRPDADGARCTGCHRSSPVIVPDHPDGSQG